jgi:hypothetical protein
MTTGLAVRTAWQENIFDSATVAAMTSRVYLYDVLADTQLDASRLIHNPGDGSMPLVNFMVCLVRRKQAFDPMANIDQTFEVRLTYYLQQTDVAESTYNTLADRLESIDDLVRTALTANWDNTVDYYSGGEPERIDVTTVDGRQCWRGAVTYLGFKAIFV